MGRSTDFMGSFLEQVAIFYKEEQMAPLGLNAAPLKFHALSRSPLERLISNTIFESNMQIRGLLQQEDKHPWPSVSVAFIVRMLSSERISS
jgi:hypothetical protein